MPVLPQIKLMRQSANKNRELFLTFKPTIFLFVLICVICGQKSLVSNAQEQTQLSHPGSRL
jgi:hypothetical protein